MDAAVTPTCTETGLTEGKHCSVCNTVLVAQETVAATGHTEVIDEAVPATCTTDGKTQGSHCSVCNAIIVEQEVIPAGHTFGEWVTVKEATTGEEGLQERTCTVCGAKETQKLDKLPEETDPTDPSDPSEPSHEHQYGQWVVVKDPTSTEDGLEERTCGCGKSELRIIPKLSNPFTDVRKGDFFFEPVLWASYKGITSGMTPTTFGPNQSCTRAHIVTFLYRAAGEPEVKTTKNPFTDVKEGTFYYKAVLWAVENEVTTGMRATSFAPNSTCTRGQIVTFLYRAAKG